uniref:Putative pcna-associated factor-like isoform x2 n=1 Tax=Amblyomma tuberculatum TaxID=48802 RepID=A0A6M2E282_9ACAR
MARTLADRINQATGAKNTGKALAARRDRSTGQPKCGKYRRRNPSCPRPTPQWQKEISGFLVKPKDSNDERESSQGVSGSDTSDGGATGSSSSSHYYAVLILGHQSFHHPDRCCIHSFAN